MNDLEPLDPSYVENVLSNPPFIKIPGVINVRDLGGYPSIEFPDKCTRPRFLFRSAELSNITEEGAHPHTHSSCFFSYAYSGKEQLRNLGIRKVFDLRSDTEMEKYSAPLPTIEGIEIVRAPVFQKEDYSPEMMAK